MPRLADPRKLAAWRQRFERFSKSGLAVGPFCEREGVSTASFYYWRKKLKPSRQHRRRTDGHPRRSAGLAGHRGTFRQVAVVPAGSGFVPAMPAICIHLPCGTRIELGGGDLDVLRTVIGSVAAGERAADFLTLVASAVRNDLDVWAYLKDILDRLLAGETDYAALRPDAWRRKHPEAIREYRVTERRNRADRKHHRRAARRGTRSPRPNS